MSATNGQQQQQQQQQQPASVSSSSSSASNNNNNSSELGKQTMIGTNGGNTTNNRANLIVNYLPQSIKEHDFNLLFSKIGPVKSCKLMFDRQTGYSFGYGFVEYMNEEDAKKAIDAFNGYQIEHKRLKVAFARPNCEETKNTNLYIRNIPPNYDEAHLHELFSQYGEVIQVRLLRDQNTAYSRRIGFVIMATKQMAQMAIQHLDNTVPPDAGNEPIYVKYADEEGKKRHPPSILAAAAAAAAASNNPLGLHHAHHHHHQNPHAHHHQQAAAAAFGHHHPQQQGGHHGGGRHQQHHHQQQQQHHHHALAQQNFAATAPHHFAGMNSQFGQSSGGAYQQYGGGAGAGFNSAAAAGFMLGGSSGGQQQANANLSNSSLQNLGKMKTNRSGGHQNRYNPIGGGNSGSAAAAGFGQMNQANSNGLNASNYNPWGMNMAAAAAAALQQQQQQQQQQSYTNFGADATGSSNNLLINSGFDNLIGTVSCKFVN